MLEQIFGNTDIYAEALDGLTLRQKALAQNVANVDTPGYKRFDVAYEGQLRRRFEKEAGEQSETAADLQVGNERHFTLGPLSGGGASIERVDRQVYRNDQNNVDIEQEMARLAETTVRFNTMATLTSNKFDGLKTLIREIR